MTNCCATGSVSRELRCPLTGRRTLPLSRDTVLHHLQPALRDEAQEAGFGFCDVPNCDVVYVSSEGRLFYRNDLRTPVGLKERADPRMVCYCWSYTEREIIDDVLTNGFSSIRELIQRRVSEGRCQCERNNPSGRCCLGAVARAIKTAERMRAPRTPAPD